jgi:hypothetical protein
MLTATKKLTRPNRPLAMPFEEARVFEAFFLCMSDEEVEFLRRGADEESVRLHQGLVVYSDPVFACGLLGFGFMMTADRDPHAVLNYEDETADAIDHILGVRHATSVLTDWWKGTIKRLACAMVVREIDRLRLEASTRKRQLVG